MRLLQHGASLDSANADGENLLMQSCMAAPAGLAAQARGMIAGRFGPAQGAA